MKEYQGDAQTFDVMYDRRYVVPGGTVGLRIPKVTRIEDNGENLIFFHVVGEKEMIAAIVDKQKVDSIMVFQS